MKKNFGLLMVVVFAGILAAGCTKGYEAKQTVEGTTVALSAKTYPLVLGENTLTIKVMDPSGKPVKDAQVSVRLFIPPMPGMAPMEYTSQATAQGDAYTCSVNPAMAGGWKAEVTVARTGQAPALATFNVDAS